MKATIRGTFIEIKANMNRQANKKLNDLEIDIKKLEAIHIADTTCKETLNKLNRANYEYNRILSDRAGLWIHKYKAINFCEANMAGKLLATYLKHKQRQHNVSSVTDANKITHTDNKGILKTFMNFYQELYKKDQELDSEGTRVYLDKLDLPKITEEQALALGQDIRESEVLLAITSLKDNKAPGPDGYTAIFYKNFKALLLPLLNKLFNHCAKEGKVSDSMAEANITVIPKEGTHWMMSCSPTNHHETLTLVTEHANLG